MYQIHERKTNMLHSNKLQPPLQAPDLEQTNTDYSGAKLI